MITMSLSARWSGALQTPLQLHLHILTPYPGTRLYQDMARKERILTDNWDLYDTRHVVYQTKNISAVELERGYHWAYREFYKWNNILRASLRHSSVKHTVNIYVYRRLEKFEAVWNFLIKTKD